MLIIKAEIWPGGSEGDKFEIGELIAENISGLATVSSYLIQIRQNEWAAGGHVNIEMQTDGHRRDDGFWSLVCMVLTEAIATKRLSGSRKL